MTFITNSLKKFEKWDKELAKIADMEIIIFDEAYDAAGNILPEHNAIYVKEYDKDKERLFYGAYFKLQDRMRKILLNNNISKEDIEDKVLYPGCEKDYWKDKIIDYSLSTTHD